MAEATVAMTACGAALPRRKSTEGAGAAPWQLASPALLLFIGQWLVPLLLTFLLSFLAFDAPRGVLPDYPWRNSLEFFPEGYSHEFFRRPGGRARGVTLLC